MKQTQEMIKAKAKEYANKLNERFNLTERQKEHCETDFIAGFMQAQQEESEAGEALQRLFTLFRKASKISSHYQYAMGLEYAAASVMAEIVKLDAPAPAIESPPMEKEIFCKNYKEGGLRCADNCGDVDCHIPPAPVIESPPREKGIDFNKTMAFIQTANKMYTPASVEEKGEGEVKMYCNNCRKLTRLAMKGENGFYCFECGFKIQVTSAEKPSVKEEDAEGDLAEINLIKKLFGLEEHPIISFGDGLPAIIKALKEYAARDYKSAKGIKLPSDEEIKTILIQFGLNPDLPHSSLGKSLIEATIEKITRLNDPQGEGR